MLSYKCSAKNRTSFTRPCVTNRHDNTALGITFPKILFRPAPAPVILQRIEIYHYNTLHYIVSVVSGPAQSPSTRAATGKLFTRVYKINARVYLPALPFFDRFRRRYAYLLLKYIYIQYNIRRGVAFSSYIMSCDHHTKRIKRARVRTIWQYDDNGSSRNPPVATARV